jgi:RCC1 and BTB domain-containing protein
MVVANKDSAICVTTDEEVYTWSNANDELSSPKRVEGLDGVKVKLVACDCYGNNIICTDDCKVHVHRIERKRHEEATNEKRIEQVLEGKDIIQIETGRKHTSALTSSGYVYTYARATTSEETTSEMASTPCLSERLKEYNVVQIGISKGRYRPYHMAVIDSTPSKSRAELDKRELLNNEQHSDIVFMVEGQPIYAKKDILVARSEYFRAMFSSNMRESREGEIEITCCSRATFVVLLEYLYTDVLILTDKSNYLVHDDCSALLELYVMADMYQMDGLTILCETALESLLCPGNVLNLLLKIEKIGTAVCDRLKEVCFDLIDRKKWHNELDLSESACAWKASVSKMSLLLEIERRYSRRLYTKLEDFKDWRYEVKKQYFR